jgi:hypothetical protein
MTGQTRTARRLIVLAAAITSLVSSIGIYILVEAADYTKFAFGRYMYDLGTIGMVVANVTLVLISSSYHGNWSTETNLLIATPVNFAVFAGVGLAIHAGWRALRRFWRSVVRSADADKKS